MADSCPTEIQPVVNNYKGTGSVVKIDDFDCYVVGEGKKAIMIAYDIFGMHANCQQVADLLAKKGFLVVVPDFFRGNPWPTDNFPPKEGFEEFQKWRALQSEENRVVQTVEKTISFLKSKGAEKFGMVGFCWGGKVMFKIGAKGWLSAGATAHPSALEKSDAESIQCPVCVLPSKDEAPMDDIRTTLESNSFSSKNIWKRFDDMHHGWLGARGRIPTDYSDSQQSNRAGEAIGIFIDFFQKNL